MLVLNSQTKNILPSICVWPSWKANTQRLSLNMCPTYDNIEWKIWAMCSFLILIWPPVLWEQVQELAERVHLSIRKHPSVARFFRGRNFFQGSQNMICVPTLGDGNQLYILACAICLSPSKNVMSPTHKNSGEYIYFLTDVVACYFKQLIENHEEVQPRSPTATLKSILQEIFIMSAI